METQEMKLYEVELLLILKKYKERVLSDKEAVRKVAEVCYVKCK